MLRNRTAAAPARRPAFTLIELLVVMAIILVLTALALGAVIGLISNQQQAVTEDLFRTIDAKLRKHWEYVITQAKKETPTAAVFTLAGNGQPGVSNVAQRAQVIHTKLRLMQAFPENFNEIRNPPYLMNIGGNRINLLGDIRYTATYQKALNQSQAQVGTIYPSEYSACVLLALSIARGSAATPLTADSLPSSNVADPDGTGLKAILDSWGKPLLFVRFAGAGNGSNNLPAAAELDFLCPSPKSSQKNSKGQYIYTDPNNPALPLKLNDALDPNGVLRDPTWYSSTTPAVLQLRQTVEQNLFRATITGYYSAPYMQSMGPDSTLNTTDDLYSFRLRVGGHGD
jgi:prepilin-type N-terminal cleavage/methylation domain-containing protein